MGNSIHGQAPSEVFRIIRMSILNDTLPNKNTAADLQLLSQKEKNYYIHVINYYRAKREKSQNAIDRLKEFIEYSREYDECLENLELKEKDDIPDTIDPEAFDRQFDEEHDCDNDFLRNIVCDTKLLDLTYGLLQLELAERLLTGITENDDLRETIQSRWKALTNEERSARTMQGLTVERVNPCKEAFQNWWNNGIM